MQQWHAQQQPGTATHSCISSLLISWRLNRPRVASRYFKQLTSYPPVSSDNNYVCCDCVNVPEVGVATPKNLECASCASGWTPLSKFLDPPLNSGSFGHASTCRWYIEASGTLRYDWALAVRFFRSVLLSRNAVRFFHLVSKVQYWQLIDIPKSIYISSYRFYKDINPSPNLYPVTSWTS